MMKKLLLGLTTLLVLTQVTKLKAQFNSNLDISTFEAEAPRDVTAADLDNDGDQDVISASWGEEVVWFKNDGSGTFTEETIITQDEYWTNSVSVLDIDSDGDLDILACFHSIHGVVAYLNEDGDFSESVQVSNVNIAFKELALADIDGDGDSDIIGCSEDDGSVYWIEKIGDDLTFEDHPILSSYYPKRSVKSVDFDQDGDFDIVCSTQSQNGVSYYENLGGGEFNTEIELNSCFSVGDLDVADMNNDGLIDIVAVSRPSSKIFWIENYGSGIFADATDIEADIYGTQSVEIVDINSDGNLDVVVCATSYQEFKWYENSGDGNFDVEYDIDTETNFIWSIHSADLDNDGDFDLLTADQDHPIAWYENISDTPLSTNHVMNDFEIEVFPNPTSDWLFVNVSCNKGYIEIYNSLGVKVRSEPISGSSNQLLLDEFLPGHYIIKVLDNADSVVSKRFVIN